MKTNLTLIASSMLFFSNVNLLRGKSIDVDSDVLSVSDIRNLNKYIANGTISSSNGLLPEEIGQDTAVVEVEDKQDDLLVIPRAIQAELVVEAEVAEVAEVAEDPTPVEEAVEEAVEEDDLIVETQDEEVVTKTDTEEKPEVEVKKPTARKTISKKK